MALALACNGGQAVGPHQVPGCCQCAAMIRGVSAMHMGAALLCVGPMRTAPGPHLPFATPTTPVATASAKPAAATAKAATTIAATATTTATASVTATATATTVAALLGGVPAGSTRERVAAISKATRPRRNERGVRGAVGDGLSWRGRRRGHAADATKVRRDVPPLLLALVSHFPNNNFLCEGLFTRRAAEAPLNKRSSASAGPQVRCSRWERANCSGGSVIYTRRVQTPPLLGHHVNREKPFVYIDESASASRATVPSCSWGRGHEGATITAFAALLKQLPGPRQAPFPSPLNCVSMWPTCMWPTC